MCFCHAVAIKCSMSCPTLHTLSNPSLQVVKFIYVQRVKHVLLCSDIFGLGPSDVYIYKQTTNNNSIN